MARRSLIALVGCAPEFEAEFSAYLERHGHDVKAVPQVWEATATLASSAVDVMVIGDAVSPGPLLDLLRGRRGEPGPAILLLRKPTDVIERVLSLELGADDVVEAPFNLRELAARIAGLLSRRGRSGAELVALEKSTVDLRSAIVMHADGQEEALSPGQVALFRLFLANPSKVLSRDDIIAAAPAETHDAFDRSIDSRIVRLRRKLDTESIVTIRGFGYRFDPPKR